MALDITVETLFFLYELRHGSPLLQRSAQRHQCVGQQPPHRLPHPARLEAPHTQSAGRDTGRHCPQCDTNGLATARIGTVWSFGHSAQPLCLAPSAHQLRVQCKNERSPDLRDRQQARSPSRYSADGRAQITPHDTGRTCQPSGLITHDSAAA